MKIVSGPHKTYLFLLYEAKCTGKADSAHWHILENFRQPWIWLTGLFFINITHYILLKISSVNEILDCTIDNQNIHSIRRAYSIFETSSHETQTNCTGNK